MYSTEIEPKCASCQKANPLSHTELEYVCELHGIVAYNHCCKKYKYDVFTKKLHRRKNIDTDYDAMDFSIE